MTVALSPEYRAKALETLAAKEFDVLVIGGGVVGAGAALDAATRGMSVAVVEAQDWASGTSSRSSKLLHGGLRYLEMLDFRLVHEALIERGLSLTKLAPHLARPVSFLYPLTHRGWERPYVGSGIALYDVMARTSGNNAGLPLHRHFGSRGLKKIAPDLREDAMHGAIRYYDAQIDDARHTMTIVRSAVDHGAVAVSRLRVESLEKDGDRVVGARVVDDENGGESFVIRARVVVNSTGIWTDEMQELAGTEGDFHVRTSKGVHFVVAKDKIKLDTGLILRTEKSVLFVIPWGNHWIIGTTDTDYKLNKQHPATSSADIDYLLEHVNAVLKRPLTRDDIQGTFEGLRPLLAGTSSSTAKLSREHAVSNPVPGLVVIAGGKYTTYRVMGKDAIDLAIKSTGHTAKSITEDIPLVGADGYKSLKAMQKNKAKQWNMLPRVVGHMLGRYGSLTPEIAALVVADRSLAQNLPGTEEYIKAEVVYAATHEGAMHVEDVLARRTRMSFESTDRGLSAATEVARLMGETLGWDAKKQAHEVELWQKLVAAELDALTKPDDESADEARLAAPEPVDHRLS